MPSAGWCVRGPSAAWCVRVPSAGWLPSGSEVEAGAPVDPLRGHGVNVPLAQDDVLLALHLDLEPVLRVEEHLVPDLDRADVWSDGHRLGPGQAPGHLGRG